MASLSEAFEIALQHHQAGRLVPAEQIYRQILAADPNHADSLHLLGVIALQLGQHANAIQCICRAIELRPNEFAYHSNLGNVNKAQGNVDGAIRSYQKAIELQPDQPEVFNNLGTAFQARGEPVDAIHAYRRSIELKRDNPQAHSNLGTALHELGHFDEAAQCYRRAIELRPNDAIAYCNLGNALRSQRRLSEAADAYRRAVELKPDYVEALNNLGSTLRDQGRLDEAVAAYRQALFSKRDDVDVLYNLGIVFQKQEKLEEAADCFRRVVHQKPNFAEAHNNLGNAIYDQGQLDEAAACFRKAVALNPSHAGAYGNLGNVLQSLGHFEEAVDCYQRAIAIEPKVADTFANLGAAFQQLGRFDDATSNYSRALELDPQCFFARYAQATLQLLQGDFPRIWPEYESIRKQLRQRGFSQPRWDGSPLDGRTLLLHAEQGLGDTIQFHRYSALIKKQNPNAAVIFECQPPLRKLLSRSQGFDRLIARGDELPPFDVHLPMLSVTEVFQTTLDSLPAETPYLIADSALVEQWRAKLDPLRGLRVGINWQGRPAWRWRDIPLEGFRSLAELTGVRLISLQKGDGREQLATAQASGLSIVDLGDDLDTANGAFMDTAAVMMNLDLVITSDTAIPHLAGALGVPVWLALPFVSDWRWLLDRSDSPWYPTMRLFRQKAVGDWAGVFDDMRDALRRMQSTAGKIN